VGSELLGSATLPLFAWLILILLPIIGAIVSTLVARFTVIGVLKKML
jgi:cell division transport system permease protein